MEKFGIKNPKSSLEELGITGTLKEHWNPSPEKLVGESIEKGMGKLTESGAIRIKTGTFTGRSPQDRFIVKDKFSEKTVDWGSINKPISPENYKNLRNKIRGYFQGKEVYVRDAVACTDENYRFKIRVVTEYPWSNQFVYNMFLRPSADEVLNFQPDWTVLCAPGLTANPKEDGTRQENFAIINFTERQAIIGGTAYTGEIKKGIFSVLNYILPKDHGVLAMHCSANMGKEGDTAIFFGLSGTGKTTLSADPDRYLIGDDEHGWSENGIFNFEAGCYAKCIDLEKEKEPEIYAAIKHRAILENVRFFENSRRVDFTNDSITVNTRVSYPIYHIDNAVPGSKGGHPKNVFFLTADAFGVLPPISKLTPEQAMYYFISGYTAKVAGTEVGVVDPVAAFSACFGAPFLPLHATVYAEMLGEKLKETNANVWLVNTGWTGGSFGVGSRIKLRLTRAMISAALEGELNSVDYQKHPIFGLNMPKICPGVPTEVLSPKETWKDKKAYDKTAKQLAQSFVENFKKFEDKASKAIIAAGPKVSAK